MDSLIIHTSTIDRQPGEIDGIVGNNTLSCRHLHLSDCSGRRRRFLRMVDDESQLMLTILNDTSVSVNANGYGTGTLTVKVYTDKRVQNR